MKNLKIFFIFILLGVNLAAAEVIIEGTPQLARPFNAAVELEAPAVLDIERSSSDDFTIIGIARNNENILQMIITIVPFTLGETDFPQLIFIDENGREIKTEPFKIEIAPAKTRIRTKGLVDIRGPYRPFNWLLVAVVIAAVILIGFIIYKIRKYRAAPPVAQQPNPYLEGRPYHIVALEQIDNLLMQDLWQRGLFKIFYINLTDIYRDYLTARFGIEADKYTSRDLARRLRNINEFKSEMALVERFHKSADLVKFAKVVPDEASRDQDINNLRKIINDTRQQDEPAGDKL